MTDAVHRLFPGDCLLVAKKAGGGLVMLVGTNAGGISLMLCRNGRTSFGAESWHAVRSSLDSGQTRRLAG